MRITRTQIRNIIKESLNEGYMKQRFAEVADSIESVLAVSPGIAGEALAAEVMEDLADYGMADPAMALDKQEVFDILDVMMEEGDVFFDIEEDRFYWAQSPEGLKAQQAMVNRA